MWSPATMPGWNRTRTPAAGCSKRGWMRARIRAMCCTTSPSSNWLMCACRWGPCTRPRCVPSPSSIISSMPANTTARTSALCPTATMPALWRALPASTTPPAIFWTRAARWWAPTTVRCATRWASARALGWHWGPRCTSAARTCRPTRSPSARRVLCSTASSMRRM